VSRQRFSRFTTIFSERLQSEVQAGNDFLFRQTSLFESLYQGSSFTEIKVELLSTVTSGLQHVDERIDRCASVSRRFGQIVQCFHTISGGVQTENP
jgi:hypothetical protein